MNVEGFYARGNSNIYEARKAFSADSKPFSVPAEAPVSADTPPPVSPPSNFQSETYSNSQYDYRSGNAFMQVDSQRDKEEVEPGNFLEKYMKKEEEEEDKKDDGLVDYLLEALKGEEKEMRMEGNSHMSDEEKLKYYHRNFPGLFS